MERSNMETTIHVNDYKFHKLGNEEIRKNDLPIDLHKI